MQKKPYGNESPNTSEKVEENKGGNDEQRRVHQAF